MLARRNTDEAEKLVAKLREHGTPRLFNAPPPAEETAPAVDSPIEPQRPATLNNAAPVLTRQSQGYESIPHPLPGVAVAI